MPTDDKLVDTLEPSTTYRRDFKPPTQYPLRPKSTQGTLAREGILPITTSSVKGIGGTRFLSQSDVQLAAFASFLRVNPFPEKPFTQKEERMVRGEGYGLGLFVQRGDFLGKKRCVVKKLEIFDQYQTNIKDVRHLLGSKKIDYAAIWRDQGTICKTDKVRLDIQVPTKTQQNLQIQVNKTRNKYESTSVATALVNRNLSTLNKKIQQAHVVRKTKNALFLSAQTGSIYEVTLGEPPPLSSHKLKNN